MCDEPLFFFVNNILYLESAIEKVKLYIYTYMYIMALWHYGPIIGSLRVGTTLAFVFIEIGTYMNYYIFNILPRFNKRDINK